MLSWLKHFHGEAGSTKLIRNFVIIFMGFFDCLSGRDAHTPELLRFEKRSCGWKKVVCHAGGLTINMLMEL